MLIAVDIDGVVCDTVGSLCPRLKEKYGLEIKPTDITEWNLETDTFDLYSEIKEAQKDPQFMIVLKPIVGSQKAIKRLAEKHEIVFMTARPNHCKPATSLWIYHHFGDYPIYHSPGQGGHGEKETFEFDILIDDSPVNVINAANSGRKVIMLLQPWNEKFYVDDPRIIRLRIWEEITGVLL